MPRPVSQVILDPVRLIININYRTGQGFSSSSLCCHRGSFGALYLFCSFGQYDISKLHDQMADPADPVPQLPLPWVSLLLRPTDPFHILQIVLSYFWLICELSVHRVAWEVSKFSGVRKTQREQTMEGKAAWSRIQGWAFPRLPRKLTMVTSLELYHLALCCCTDTTNPKGTARGLNPVPV